MYWDSILLWKGEKTSNGHCMHVIRNFRYVHFRGLHDVNPRKWLSEVGSELRQAKQKTCL